MNARDVEDAISEGLEKYQQFQMEFDEEWNRPYTDMAAKMAWQNLGTPLQDIAKQRMPQQFKEVDKRFGNGI